MTGSKFIGLCLIGYGILMVINENLLGVFLIFIGILFFSSNGRARGGGDYGDGGYGGSGGDGGGGGGGGGDGGG